MTDPRRGNIHLDANALEPPDPADKGLVSDFLRLRDEEVISVVNPHGVQLEVNDPRTPSSTKMDMSGIFTIQTNLTSEERSIRSRLQDLIRGNAAAGRHVQDANHIFEASKYGGIYFITHDKRILAKKSEVERLLGPRPSIVNLRQFVDICRQYRLF